MTDKMITCTCKEPIYGDIAAIDFSDYVLCQKCGLPIEKTGVPAGDEE